MAYALHTMPARNVQVGEVYLESYKMTEMFHAIHVSHAQYTCQW